MSKMQTRLAFNQVMPDETVVVVEEQGTIYLIPPLAPPIRLNHSASTLWKCIQGCNEVRKAAQKYSRLAAIPPTQATEETLQFINWLVKENLVKAL